MPSLLERCAAIHTNRVPDVGVSSPPIPSLENSSYGSSSPNHEWYALLLFSRSQDSGAFSTSTESLVFNKRVAKGKEPTRPQGPNWEKHQDRVLVDIVMKEADKTNNRQGNFTVHSWQDILREFNAQLKIDMTKTQLKGQWCNLKSKFQLYKKLMKLSGCGWDDVNHVPIPGYPGAWDEAIKYKHLTTPNRLDFQGNPGLGKIKMKPLPLYQEMSYVCGGTSYTGDHADGTVRRKTNENEKLHKSTGNHVQQFLDVLTSPTNKKMPLMNPDFMETSNHDFVSLMNTSPNDQHQNHQPVTPGVQSTPCTQADEGTSVPNRRLSIGKEKKERGKRIDKETMREWTASYNERNALLESLKTLCRGPATQENAMPTPSMKDYTDVMKSTLNLPRLVYLNALDLFKDPNFLDEVLDLLLDDEDVYNATTEAIFQQIQRDMENVVPRYLTANEQLAMFLYVAGHGVPMGALCEHFQHSSQTISHYVNKVTFALASLKYDFLLLPTNSQVLECHPHISGSKRYYPYFKDVIGAIDDTNIPAHIPVDNHPRFRNRK
ncbi:hypothetical protein Taro_016552 [Colocasia esculenta]|uniref:Myb/SANT-like domain-containing protein n=1 Tax=Colocasia esculenta TaxID=4460 RepID=A0A843UNU6_COLES|nr:hypothetical protein [Colocasia esculenta]